MSDELSKDRRRAVRRKRNFIAKELKENKLYAPKVVEKKRTRKNIRVQEIDRLMEDYDNGK